METRTRAATTPTTTTSTRGGGLSHSLVDSDDDEVEVLPDELRQLQREAGEESPRWVEADLNFFLGFVVAIGKV